MEQDINLILNEIRRSISEISSSLNSKLVGVHNEIYVLTQTLKTTNILLGLLVLGVFLNLLLQWKNNKQK
ncbi:hypothetical protein SY83_09660 [Paenibacillus swuensis]|uniref:Uncharacterized protein n=1 Tax=Paenibacillus swuensis TaxID=1178515 RepID=A0A172THG7_9BACL|nr:hypothetical protein SY83_09660 [Paenibacillus swuensis]